MATSAQRKLGRGIEQVKTLRGDALAFENRNAYVFSKEIESRSVQEIRYRCFATEREAPPDDWPLLAGEAVQNLRSALDHVIWACVRRPTRQTGFPIFTDPCEFQVVGSKQIARVPKPIKTIIENAQPYKRSPSAPADDLLEQLRVLSNLDKHRTLATVASAVQHEGVGTPEDVSITWHEFATDKPLGSGKTHISTFTATSETEVKEVDVQPMFAYQVRIEGRPLDVLVGIAREVFRVIAECDTGKPLSPLAPYPI